MATAKEKNMALEALERIAKHEEECGKRWAEAVAELKALRAATDAHAERWEKLAWIVVGAVIAGSIAATAANFI
jgi:hypothetical protein